MKDKFIESKNKRIILELAMFLNKELFSDGKISYQMYQRVNDVLLKKIEE